MRVVKQGMVWAVVLSSWTLAGCNSEPPPEKKVEVNVITPGTAGGARELDIRVPGVHVEKSPGGAVNVEVGGNRVTPPPPPTP